MIDLTKRWPVGLNRKNWPDYLKVLLLLLFALIFVDGWVSQSLTEAPPVWRAPFFFITSFGLSDWILLPTLPVFLLSMLACRLIPSRQGKRAAYELGLVSGFTFLAVAIPGLLAAILKRLFGRGRPEVFDLVGPFDFQRVFNDWTYQSFPSGHSTTAMAVALVAGFIAPRYFSLLFIIAVMTGISRVVVGDHYPSDVLAGFALGTVGAFAVRNYFASRGWLFSVRSDGSIRFKGLPSLFRACRLQRQLKRA